MIACETLLEKIRSYHLNPDEKLIREVYEFSRQMHANQLRHSGESYFSHPVEVANILADLKLDQASIAAALLHDIIEDTPVKKAELEERFGSEIANLVEGMTNLSKIEIAASSEPDAENFRKLTLAMSNDIRVLLIKLADRLHNMRTISHVPSKEKRVRKSKEVIDIYGPLAGRIGLSKIKDELQDLAFEQIDPDSRAVIIENLNTIREKKQDTIQSIISEITGLLIKSGIKFEITGREKTPYSIFEKMRRKKMGLSMLYDIMAFRIIVDSISECYHALGLINSTYSMIPGTFKDYISTPKENGYQSLHLTVLGPFGKKIEIQIRDRRMHEISELGCAAHWRYKETGSKNSQNPEADKYKFLRDLVMLFETSENASEAFKEHRLDIHKDEVFCFTPTGDIFNLPQGSTIIDFAYAVHSEVGNSCTGAKVNGVIAPLRQKLNNGDQVEIITSSNSRPSPNWLHFVVTSRARSAIRSFTRKEKFSEYRNLGEAIVTRFFASKDLEISEKALSKILPSLRIKSIDDLYVRIADGTIGRHDVLKLVYPNYQENVEKEPVIKTRSTKQESDKKKSAKQSIPIEGLVEGMAMRFARCCNPVPGDDISGIINTGTGITIHSQNCSNFKNIAINPQRVIDVSWKGNNNIDGRYLAKIYVTVENFSGSLAEVSSVLAKKEVNIANLKVINRSSDYFELEIDIEVANIDNLYHIISSIRLLKKIVDVRRG